jgi:alkanesulfonate monooxygenase SsuD/methylene tetrahydromethanopterin reductase-like flavin-dependent oxidoreductase (luciferase family)
MDKTRPLALRGKTFPLSSRQAVGLAISEAAPANLGSRCAEHQYPYIGLGTALGPTCDLWDVYADEAAKLGYQAGPENFGYLIPTFVAETEEKAQELGKGFVYGGGQNAFSRPEYTLPPGYNSKSAIKMLARHPGGSWLGVSPEKLRQAQQEADPEETDYNEVRRKLASSYQKAQRNFQLIIGTPKTVIPRIKTLLQILRPSIFIFFNLQGPVSNADRQTCVRLLADEVTPAIRDYAKEIGLPDPYERTPGSVKFHSGTTRLPVVDRSPLDSLGLSF